MKVLKILSIVALLSFVGSGSALVKASPSDYSCNCSCQGDSAVDSSCNNCNDCCCSCDCCDESCNECFCIQEIIDNPCFIINNHRRSPSQRFIVGLGPSDISYTEEGGFVGPLKDELVLIDTKDNRYFLILAVKDFSFSKDNRYLGLTFLDGEKTVFDLKSICS